MFNFIKDEEPPIYENIDEKITPAKTISKDSKNVSLHKLKFNEFHIMDDILTDLMKDDNLKTYEYVPSGEKYNCFFKVNNTDNADRNKSSVNRRFWDDCGTWTKTTQTYSFLLEENSKFSAIYMPKSKENLVCKKKMDPRSKKHMYIALNPQPNSRDIVKIGRYYATHKSSNSYQKRVTWVEEADARFKSPFAIYEYR